MVWRKEITDKNAQKFEIEIGTFKYAYGYGEQPRPSMHRSLAYCTHSRELENSTY